MSNVQLVVKSVFIIIPLLYLFTYSTFLGKCRIDWFSGSSEGEIHHYSLKNEVILHLRVSYFFMILPLASSTQIWREDVHFAYEMSAMYITFGWFKASRSGL